MSRLAVIVPLYQGKRHMKDLVEGLATQSYKDFCLIGVDNNPLDGTSKELRYLAKILGLELHILLSNYNQGFAKAINRGITKGVALGCDRFLFLNQDTHVESNLLQKGMALLEDISYGILVPKILHKEKNTVWWIGTQLRSKREIVLRWDYKISDHIGKGRKYTARYQHTFEQQPIRSCEALTGCAMMTRLDVLKRVGLLDESYFMYGEDLDYSLRVRKKGFNIGVITQATVYHKEQKDLRDKTVMEHFRSLRKYGIYLRSVYIFLWSHYGWGIAIIWVLKLPISLMLEYIKKQT